MLNKWLRIVAYASGIGSSFFWFVTFKDMMNNPPSYSITIQEPILWILYPEIIFSFVSFFLLMVVMIYDLKVGESSELKKEILNNKEVSKRSVCSQ